MIVITAIVSKRIPCRFRKIPVDAVSTSVRSSSCGRTTSTICLPHHWTGTRTALSRCRCCLDPTLSCSAAGYLPQPSLSFSSSASSASSSSQSSTSDQRALSNSSVLLQQLRQQTQEWLEQTSTESSSSNHQDQHEPLIGNGIPRGQDLLHAWLWFPEQPKNSGKDDIHRHRQLRRHYQPHGITWERVHVTFAIVDRLLELITRSHHSSSHSGGGNLPSLDRSEQTLIREWIHSIVLRWQDCLKEHNFQITDHPSWTPDAVLLRLDAWSLRFVTSTNSSSSPAALKWYGRTLSILISVAAKLNRADLAYQLYQRFFTQSALLPRNYNGKGNSGSNDDDDDDDLFVPSDNTTNTVLFAFAKRSDATTTRALIQQAIQAGFPVNIFSYNALFHAYSLTGQAKTAQALLEQMMTRVVHSAQEAVVPNVRTFNSVLAAWAKSGQDEAPEEAERIVRRLLDPYDWGAFSTTRSHNEMAYEDDEDDPRYFSSNPTTTTEPLRPDTITFNTVLTCWASQASLQRPHAALRALALLRDMQAWSNQILERHPDLSTTLTTEPDIFTYAIVINALAKAGMAEKAQEVFSTVFQLFLHEGRDDLKPNLYLVTPLLKAWMKPSKDTNLSLSERLERTKKTWQQMQQLSQFGVLQAMDTHAYNVMLLALAQGKDVEGAMALLEEMRQLRRQKQQRRGGEPSKANTIILPSASSFNVQPDFDSYSIVIHLILSMANRAPTDTIKAEMVQRAVALWEEVQNQFEWISRTSNADNKSVNHHMTRTNQSDDDPTTNPCYPTQTSINSLAKVFAKIGELDRAEAIMRQLCAEARALYHRRRQRRLLSNTTSNRPSDGSLVPDPRCFTAVLAALSRSDDPQAARRVEYLLTSYAQLYETGVIADRPDYFMYKVLMQAWCHQVEHHKRLGAGDMALWILKQCEEKFGKEEARRQYYDGASKSSRDYDDDVFHPSDRRERQGSRENMPSTTDYNMVLLALMRARRTRRKGERLLDEMIEPYLPKQPQHNLLHWSANSQNQQPHKWIPPPPTCFSFNIVLANVARGCQSDERLAKMEQLMAQMKTLHDVLGDGSDLAPNNTTYTNYLWGLAVQAESLKKRAMPKEEGDNHRPSAIGHSKNDRIVALAQRAQDVLDSLPAPGFLTYRHVITTWIHAGDLERAEQVLVRLTEHCQQGTFHLTRGNSGEDAFAALARAWKEAGRADRAEHLRQVWFSLLDNKVEQHPPPPSSPQQDSSSTN